MIISNGVKKILILEPGAWGTVLGILLSKKNKVSFWYEDSQLSLKIYKERKNERLPGVKIPKNIFISSNLREVIRDADLVIIASPSFNFRETLLNLKISRNLPPLLGIAKGIEKGTLKLPSQIVEEIFGKIPYAHLSGPGFAKEIIQRKEAKEVIAAKDPSFLKWLKELFRIRPLEVSTTADLIGVQLAGALKNALSISISLVEAGCKNPENFKFKDLITSSLKEMVKLGTAMGAKKETFWGPAGLGDLILTSTSSLSRNFQFGRNLYCDADKMRQDIKERKMTVEGFDSVYSLYKLGKIYKLDLPMINEVYKVIYKKISPQKTIKNLIKLTEKK